MSGESVAAGFAESSTQFKGIFDYGGQVPTCGLVNGQRFVLGAVFVYQLSLWYHFEAHQNLRVGPKAFLKAT